MATPQFQALENLFFLTLLPNELVFEILLWLPVRSVARFRCVCKSWKALFSDPGFAELHLRRAMGIKRESMLLVRHLSFRKHDLFSLNEQINYRRWFNMVFIRGHTVYELLETYSMFGKEPPSHGMTDVVRVPHNVRPYFYTIIDSSNGIVCLTDTTIDGRSVLLELVLWNPSTLEKKPIGCYCINRYEGYVIVTAYGFVFNPVLVDYQVVRIVEHYDHDSYVVEMYSLRAESWKTVPNVDIGHCNIHHSVSQAFVNGAFHWVASTKAAAQNLFILAFDTMKETFCEISLPPGSDHLKMDEFVLHKRYDSLSLVVRNKDCGGFEVWVLEEYGVGESWSKQVWVECSRVDVMKPLHVFDDGKRIVMDVDGSHNLAVCNSNFQMIQYLPVFTPARIVNHVNSQISLRHWTKEIQVYGA